MPCVCHKVMTNLSCAVQHSCRSQSVIQSASVDLCVRTKSDGWDSYVTAFSTWTAAVDRFSGGVNSAAINSWLYNDRFSVIWRLTSSSNFLHSYCTHTANAHTHIHLTVHSYCTPNTHTDTYTSVIERLLMFVYSCHIFMVFSIIYYKIVSTECNSKQQFSNDIIRYITLTFNHTFTTDVQWCIAVNKTTRWYSCNN